MQQVPIYDALGHILCNFIITKSNALGHMCNFIITKSNALGHMCNFIIMNSVLVSSSYFPSVKSKLIFN